MISEWRKSSHSGAVGNCVELAWRKASHSGGDNGSQCVEVAHAPDAVLVRDSKNATGPRLRLPVASLAGLVALARA